MITIDLVTSQWQQQFAKIPRSFGDKCSAFAKNLFNDLAVLSGLAAAGCFLYTRKISPYVTGLTILTIVMAALRSLFKDYRQEEQQLIRKGRHIAIEVEVYAKSFVELAQILEKSPELQPLFSLKNVRNEVLRPFITSKLNYTETRAGLLVNDLFPFEFDEANKKALVEKLNKQIRQEKFLLHPADFALGIDIRLQAMGADLEKARNHCYTGSDMTDYDADVIALLQDSLIDSEWKNGVLPADSESRVDAAEITAKYRAKDVAEVKKVGYANFRAAHALTEGYSVEEQEALRSYFVLMPFKDLVQYQGDAATLGVTQMEALLFFRYDQEMMTSRPKNVDFTSPYFMAFADKHPAQLQKIVALHLQTKPIILDPTDPVTPYLTPAIVALQSKAQELHDKEEQDFQAKKAKIEQVRSEYQAVPYLSRGLKSALTVETDEAQIKAIEEQIQKMDASTDEINAGARASHNKRCDEQLAFWKTWFDQQIQNITRDYHQALNLLT